MTLSDIFNKAKEIGKINSLPDTIRINNILERKYGLIKIRKIVEFHTPHPGLDSALPILNKPEYFSNYREFKKFLYNNKNEISYIEVEVNKRKMQYFLKDFKLHNLYDAAFISTGKEGTKKEYFIDGEIATDEQLIEILQRNRLNKIKELLNE